MRRLHIFILKFPDLLSQRAKIVFLIHEKLLLLLFFIQHFVYCFLCRYSQVIQIPARAEVFLALLMTFFLQLENQKIAIFAAQIFFSYFTCIITIFTLFSVYSVANNTVSL